MPLQLLLLTVTTLFQLLATEIENRQPPPGQLISIQGSQFHYQVRGQGEVTVVLDHSLGGIEGYFLIEPLAQLTRVFIYDRAGYGGSEKRSEARTSEQIVKELDALLTQTQIEPPYILLGNSFGSYNLRLYAHRFPEKVVGLILTDGLHERGMLQLPFRLEALVLFFMSGFIMSTVGSHLGLVRLLQVCGCFELLKPQLKPFPAPALTWVKRSFCRPQHWLTMFREMISLKTSGEQLAIANHFPHLPIVLITAQSFFHPSGLTFFFPIQTANQLREKMHYHLRQLSANIIQLKAEKSSHFVWIDQPDIIIQGVALLLTRLESSST